MTVSTTTNRISYAGNGVTTAFSFPYLFIDNADLVVLLVADATGVEDPQTLTTNYTLAGAGIQAGGTVTMLVAPAAGTTLVIYRDPAITQPVDLVNNDPLPVETAVELPLDRLTLIAQRLKDLYDRTVKLPEGDTGISSEDMKLPPAVSRANGYLAFDADGILFISTAQSGAPTSAFMAAVLSGADTTAALLNLLSSPSARFRADFTSTPRAVRLCFQTTTADSRSVVQVIPNATGVNGLSCWRAFNDLDPDNANYVEMGARSDLPVVYFDTNAFGTGTVKSYSFRASDVEIGTLSLLGVWGGTGFKFPAVQVASADPNILDDYEEGTWTPAFTFATPGDLNVGYSTQVGTYTKKGREVTAHFTVVTSAFTHTTAAGTANITGLPFTIANTTGLTPVGTLQWSGVTKVNYTQVTCRGVVNTTTLDLPASGSGQTTGALQSTDLPTGGSVILRGSITYNV